MDSKASATAGWAERLSWILFHPGYRGYVLRKVCGAVGIDVDRILRAAGYRFEFLDRVVLYRAWDAFLAGQNIAAFDALEISPGDNSRWHGKGFRSYSAVQYPAFDICRDTLDRRFDLVIIDNVLEHVAAPAAAIRNAAAMLRAGGILLVSTPFLIKVHGAPYDFSRWTEPGLRRLLEDCGFEPDRVTSGAWGNRACVKASLYGWPMQGWRRKLENEPEFPVMVWCIARKA